MAAALAKREAELELVCRFRGMQCAEPRCNVGSAIQLYDLVCETRESLVSQEDAEYQARVAAHASAVAFCTA